MPPDEDERMAQEWSRLEEQPITGTEPRIRISKSGFKTIELERRIPTGIDPAKFGGIGGIGVGFEETEGGLRKVSDPCLGLVFRDRSILETGTYILKLAGTIADPKPQTLNLLGRLRTQNPKPQTLNLLGRLRTPNPKPQTLNLLGRLRTAP